MAKVKRVRPKSKKHIYFISFIDYAIMNPDYDGWTCGRMEIDDDKGPYAINEIPYYTSKSGEFFHFREKYDFKYYTQKELDRLVVQIKTLYNEEKKDEEKAS